MKKDKITKFHEQYEFLSNFCAAPILYNGITYLNSEAAFQAQKSLDQGEREDFSTLPPNVAKRKGRKITLRPDWEEVKDIEMENICYEKFTQNIVLREKLLKTGNAFLIEGNTWHDNYWGICECSNCQENKKGVNGNHLGKTLMRVRDKIRRELLVETMNCLLEDETKKNSTFVIAKDNVGSRMGNIVNVGFDMDNNIVIETTLDENYTTK